MTMLEKIARAIAASSGVLDGFDQRRDGTVVVPSWHKFIPQARAALEAMKTPTEGMRTAGKEAQSEENWPDPWPQSSDGYDLAPDYITTELVWEHMINAALEGK